MKLTLSITSIQRTALSGAAIKTFDEGGGSIGRGEENDWALPDPQRILSARHALVTFQNGQFHLTDTSTNGTFHNRSEQPIGKGRSCTLHEGDVLTLGGYEIVVSLSAGQQPVPASTEPLFPTSDEVPAFFKELTTPTPARTQIPEHYDLAQEPLFGEQQFTPESGLVPELQPQPAPPPPSEPDNLPSYNEFFQPPQAIPDDWDEDFATKPTPEAPPLVPLTSAPSLQAEPSTLSAPETLPAQETTPAREVPRPGGGTRRTLPPHLEDTSPRLNEHLEQVTPAPVATPVPISAPPPPAPTLPAAAITTDLLRAFLEGAGVSTLELKTEEAPQMMHQLGAVMREMLSGMIQALNERAKLKSDFRMAMTMIRPTENNPLKFCASPEEAIAVILKGRGPGYMAPVDAVQESFADITAHQLAMMAGMQAAVNGLLQRFDPKTLEQSFQSSLIDTLLPGMKKAKCWELFNATYQEISREAEAHFQALLGDEFGHAYETQMDRLKHGKH